MKPPIPSRSAKDRHHPRRAREPVPDSSSSDEDFDELANAAEAEDDTESDSEFPNTIIGQALKNQRASAHSILRGHSPPASFSHSNSASFYSRDLSTPNGSDLAQRGPRIVWAGRGMHLPVLIWDVSLVLDRKGALDNYSDKSETSSSESDQESEGHSRKYSRDQDGQRSDLMRPEVPLSPGQSIRKLVRQYKLALKASRTEYEVIRLLFERHGFRQVTVDSPSLDWNLMWTGNHPRLTMYRQIRDFQRVNHFPHSFELTRKDRLCRNVQLMQLSKGLKPFDIIPLTFVMPGTSSISTCTCKIYIYQKICYSIFLFLSGKAYCLAVAQ